MKNKVRVVNSWLIRKKAGIGWKNTIKSIDKFTSFLTSFSVVFSTRWHIALKIFSSMLSPFLFNLSIASCRDSNLYQNEPEVILNLSRICLLTCLKVELWQDIPHSNLRTRVKSGVEGSVDGASYFDMHSYEKKKWIFVHLINSNLKIPR